MSTTRAERPRTLDPYLGAVLGGRYRIERLIGRGGMGLVYLATDEVDARDVVIKLLAPHFVDDATAVSRFEREGKRLQQLAHPNVVQLLECGHDRGQAYIAMEYLDGEPLRRHLKRRGPLPLQEFTPIAAQILAAVGYAHDRSIMLRDIKPANIMLCERDGKANFVKVLDFGLAKLVDGDDEEVTKSHVIGTAGYLAPEQIKGEPSDVRVDVYAIGVMLYVMLSGESPIQGENDGALLYNHVHGTPKPLGSVLPAGHNIPEALIALVHQCLEKDPTRRPADASEIAEALFESVPPKLFALPPATDDSRKALAEYRSARDRGLDADAGPQSSEWTKPVVRPAGEPAPAEASTSALPRPPRRGTPVPPPRPRRASQPEVAAQPRPRRASQPEVAAATPRTPASSGPVVAPPVRMPRPRPSAPDLEAIALASDALAAADVGPATTAVSTPRPAETGVATETITPMPEEIGDVASGPIPVPRLPVRRRWLVVTAVLAVTLGGLLAWAMFGPGGPAAPQPIAASNGAATPSGATRPAAGDAAKPPELRPLTGGDDEEPIVIPSDATPTSPVVVRAIEGARVEVDGVDHGAAPLQTELSVGTHVIRIVAPNHAPWEQTIEVVAGQNPIVEARLRSTTPKKRPRVDGGAAAGAADEDADDVGDGPSEPMPEKAPPIKPSVGLPTEVPKVPPPPPPEPAG
jgi:serine/threonine protein kinase